MKPWIWTLPSAAVALLALRVVLGRPADFDVVVVSGPRRGAFFSCGCGSDRRGGMTAALALARGRVLWVEVGDAFGAEPGPVRRFLRERTASSRVSGESAAVEPIRFASGARALLVFADALGPADLPALRASPLPLLCVGAAFDARTYAALADRAGVYVTGDRRREGGGRLAVVGFEGLDGRQVTLLDGDLAARVEDVLRPPGVEADPMDVAYLEERHTAAGVRVVAEGLPPPGAGEDPGRCAACHPGAVERWRASRHAHALESLDHGAPRICFGCHSILRDRPARAEASLAVACASCHGDSGGHPGDGARVRSADCTACHTPISSPRFDRATYWARMRCDGKGAG